MEFNLLQRCFYEALRIEPPVSSAIVSTMNESQVVGGILIKKNQPFTIAIEQMHHDPKQWQSPERFIPDRFDP